MNQVENMEAWISALRSGEYEKGTECLRDADDKFCCLGVATDLAEKAGVLPPGELRIDPASDDAQIRAGVYMYEDMYSEGLFTGSVLPQKVVEWLGLNFCCPTVINSGVESLTAINDDDVLNFSELADLIEEQLLPEVKKKNNA